MQKILYRIGHFWQSSMLIVALYMKSMKEKSSHATEMLIQSLMKTQIIISTVVSSAILEHGHIRPDIGHKALVDCLFLIRDCLKLMGG